MRRREKELDLPPKSLEVGAARQPARLEGRCPGKRAGRLVGR